MATYRGIKGVKVQSLASDPSGPDGQVWYNTASSALKYQVLGGAWTSATAGNTARRNSGGLGTVTAALCIGGTPVGSYPAVVPGLVESWNGTSWTAATAMTLGRTNLASMAGIQTNAICISGFLGAPSNDTTNVETYNGSTWTETVNVNTARHSGAGIGAAGDTAAIFAGGGQYPGTGYLALTESWNGSAWTEVNNLTTARKYYAGMGTTTAGMVAGGSVPAASALTETWDGTSWTETGDLNTARGYYAGSGGPGAQTAALVFGGVGFPGPIKANTESWNGTSWSETADLGTAKKQQIGTTSGGGTTAALSAFGANTSTVVQATMEEFSFGNSVKTVTVS